MLSSPKPDGKEDTSSRLSMGPCCLQMGCKTTPPPPPPLLSQVIRDLRAQVAAKETELKRIKAEAVSHQKSLEKASASTQCTLACSAPLPLSVPKILPLLSLFDSRFFLLTGLWGPFPLTYDLCTPDLPHPTSVPCPWSTAQTIERLQRECQEGASEIQRMRNGEALRLPPVAGRNASLGEELEGLKRRVPF
jgi:hypothetical protein